MIFAGLLFPQLRFVDQSIYHSFSVLVLLRHPDALLRNGRIPSRQIPDFESCGVFPGSGVLLFRIPGSGTFAISEIPEPGGGTAGALVGKLNFQRRLPLG